MKQFAVSQSLEVCINQKLKFHILENPIRFMIISKHEFNHILENLNF